ncbi:MAG: helix-turn-helix domain-containing protein [Oscillospiraceae bacterium]|nr:helix-turn-helix domain-containing protein [Oscillospiraceae bacterium]
MTSIFSLVLAVEFIERNLTEAIRFEEVAAAAFVSPSYLYKLFSRVFNCSPGEYLMKRRLCRAADALVRENASVTELAFLYQYGSVESFSRAFKKQYLMPPSEYRKRKPHFPARFPKFIIMEGGNIMTTYSLDEHSEKLLSARGTYFLLIDIDHLKPIND